jgi:biopolymer transport protein ExbB
VEKAMEDALAREVSKLRGRLRPLNVIGNVAPLVGLLGTVVGMIMAFYMASTAGLGKPELLAQGIYLALLTTAAGLIIAIPSVLFAAYFNSRIDVFMRDMDEQLMEVMPSFSRMENGSFTPEAARGNELVAAGS